MKKGRGEVLGPYSAASRFFDCMVEYGSAIVYEFRRSAYHVIRFDYHLFQANRLALEWKLRAVGVLVDGTAPDQDALGVCRAPPDGFLRFFQKVCQRHGRREMKAMADLAEESHRIVTETGFHSSQELLDKWDSATADLAKVARNVKAKAARRQ